MPWVSVVARHSPAGSPKPHKHLPRGRTLNALVAGGAGFIGSHLCAALLDRGHQVTCVDNLQTGSLRNLSGIWDHPDLRFVEHDITAPLPPGLQPDLIFHLASPASVVDYLALPVQTMRANSLGTLNLLELAASSGAGFLFASTSEVYGDPLVHPQPETYQGNTETLGVRAPYHESKRFGEVATLEYGRSRGVDARIVRIFNTYGPHSRLDDGRIMPNFIIQALRNEPITIYGDGSQTRSFCYVSDMVEGILAAMMTAGTVGKVFNLGNPDEHSVLSLARIVAGRLGSTAEPVRRALPEGDPTRRRPDIARAEAMLGWSPTVDLPAGIARTAAWFESLLKAPAEAR
ncbi:MAG: NAD-dependent epimerase/dehydratase family protein [Chloroflexota bacterium]